MGYVLRDFAGGDAEQVNEVAVAAFSQYGQAFSDWMALRRSIAKTAELASEAEMVVAEQNGRVVGTVAYVGPGRPKLEMFDPQWSVMRMLVVCPTARGQGIGSALAKECINRAVRDRAEVFALHTSRMMEIAVAMYERMGFVWLKEAPPILGVPSGIYIKRVGP